MHDVADDEESWYFVVTVAVEGVEGGVHAPTAPCRRRRAPEARNNVAVGVGARLGNVGLPSLPHPSLLCTDSAAGIAHPPHP